MQLLVFFKLQNIPEPTFQRGEGVRVKIQDQATIAAAEEEPCKKVQGQEEGGGRAQAKEPRAEWKKRRGVKSGRKDKMR